jgi:hypothetical protein
MTCSLWAGLLTDHRRLRQVGGLARLPEDAVTLPCPLRSDVWVHVSFPVSTSTRDPGTGAGAAA